MGLYLAAIVGFWLTIHVSTEEVRGDMKTPCQVGETDVCDSTGGVSTLQLTTLKEKSGNIDDKQDDEGEGKPKYSRSLVVGATRISKMDKTEAQKGNNKDRDRDGGGNEAAKERGRKSQGQEQDIETLRLDKTERSNKSALRFGETHTGADEDVETLDIMMDYEQLYAEAVGMVPEELTNACKDMDRNSDGEITEEDFQGAPEDAWPEFHKTFKGENGVVTMAECISGETNLYLDRLEEVVAAKMIKASAKLSTGSLSAQAVADDLSAIRRGAQMPGGSIQTHKVFQNETMELKHSEEEEEEKQALDTDVHEPEQLLEEEIRGESEIEMETNGRRRYRRNAEYNADTSYSDKKGRTAVHNVKIEEIDYKHPVFKRFLDGMSSDAAGKVWSSVNLMLKVLTASDYCWRHTYYREVGWRKICPSPYHRHGLFCYKDCRSGYRKVGDHCWKDCPPGSTDIGLDCLTWVRYPEWWRSWVKMPKLLGKQSYWEKPMGLMGFGRCPSDRPDDVAGLCYQKPKDKYSCFVTTCNEDCREPLAHNCGPAACGATSQACLTNIAGMITSSIQAAVDSTLLVVTAGGYGAMKTAMKTSMTMAQKIALKSANKKIAGQMLKRVSQEAFKDLLIKTATEKAKRTLMRTEAWKRLFMAYMANKLYASGKMGKAVAKSMAKAAKGNFFEWLKQTSATEMVASVEADLTDLETGTKYDQSVFLKAEDEVVTKMLSIAGLGPLAGPLVNQLEKKFELATKDPGAFLEKMDFTGLAAAIRKTGTGVDKGKAWASALSTFDPTGWLGVAANFIHPICKDHHASIEANKNSESDDEISTKPSGRARKR